ncbi:MAG: hypothetical protein F4117_15730 [Acidimicrobiales bacterium]|nr:hypothetical protein [Acidimicrobiales bacterium]MYB81147.1 hypothetical protein [Acidimicrobiales bacterium]MYI13999.1 hypothetical protein [Acidimicrobiales bacterium]
MNYDSRATNAELGRSRTRLARYTALALLLSSSPLLAACDHVGIPERPSTAYAPDFEGMWDHPRRGSGLIHDGYLREGELIIEDSCVLIIEGGSQERIMLLLPRLKPRYGPSASRQADDEIAGLEHAIAWLPTLYDEESQSLWVGAGEAVSVGGRVTVSGFSSRDHFEKCDADWSFRANSIERWP